MYSPNIYYSSLNLFICVKKIITNKYRGRQTNKYEVIINNLWILHSIADKFKMSFEKLTLFIT